MYQINVWLQPVQVEGLQYNRVPTYNFNSTTWGEEAFIKKESFWFLNSLSSQVIKYNHVY